MRQRNNGGDGIKLAWVDSNWSIDPCPQRHDAMHCEMLVVTSLLARIYQRRRMVVTKVTEAVWRRLSKCHLYGCLYLYFVDV